MCLLRINKLVSKVVGFSVFVFLHGMTGYKFQEGDWNQNWNNRYWNMWHRGKEDHGKKLRRNCGKTEVGCGAWSSEGPTLNVIVVWGRRHSSVTPKCIVLSKLGEVCCKYGFELQTRYCFLSDLNVSLDCAVFLAETFPLLHHPHWLLRPIKPFMLWVPVAAFNSVLKLEVLFLVSV
jgi:hypothetical protein